MSNTQKKTEAQNQSENTVDQNSLFADTNISMKSGRLVKDAELIAGGKFVKIRLASNKQYESDDEVKSMTNYFNILVSSNLSKAFDIAKELQKGDWAYFKGEDSSKSFDTPEGYKQTAVTTYAYHVTKKKVAEDNAADQAEAPLPA